MASDTKIDTYNLAMAGELRVASELFRRNILALITMGNFKRIDIVAMCENGKHINISVKTKKGSEWVHVQGIERGEYLVFVDFEDKSLDKEPDFYLLSYDDWKKVVDNNPTVKKWKPKITSNTYAPLKDTDCEKGKWDYDGINIKTKELKDYKGWEKIEEFCKKLNAKSLIED